MTDKEFKRLKRSELIEIIYEYQKREQALQSRVEALQAQLDEKNLKIQQAGSIAEATAALTGKARNEVQQDTGHGNAEHYNIAGPERICYSGRIKMDGDRLRQAIIESEKDYQRQRTQNGADNNMLRCRFHKYYLL